MTKNWCIKEIYFLWGFYCRKDATWTQITTVAPVRLKDNEVLNIPLLKAEKKYDRSSNLNFILLIIPKKFFPLTELSTIGRNVVSNHLSKVNLMIHAINHFFIYFFFMVDICLKDYSSPLYIENKKFPARDLA